MKQIAKTRRLTLDALLISLALVLSLVERWIPLELIIPVPGIKLGLANIVTLFAVLRLRPGEAVLIVVTRSLILGVISGPTTLMFSLSGGLLAFFFMWLLSHWHERSMTTIGISVCGAAAHNIGQVAMAGLVLEEPLLLMTYLPPLLLTGLATGTLTGLSAYPVIKRFAIAQDIGGQIKVTEDKA
ncbi:MAG: Gx transporter family protein [Ruminococcaceae bacterium]|jgi:heptaprenyl diphosphate synthase|nr:Gx transporter family protein [Oscillospiraceae bacterium]